MTTWLASTAHADFTFSEADLLATWTATSVFGAAHASLARAASGSWYFEIEVVTAASAHDIMVGICRPVSNTDDPWGLATGYYYYTSVASGANGYLANNASIVSDAGYATFEAGDVIGVLLKNGKVYFSKNDVWQDGSDPDAETGEAFASITGDMYPSIVCYNNGDQLRAKFATASLVGTLPTGAAAWDSAPNGSLAADVPLAAGVFAGVSGNDGALAGDVPLIAGDFPGGQGTFAAMAGDVPLAAGDFVAVAAYAGGMAGDVPLISGEFIGGYSVAGTLGGDVPLIAGAFIGGDSVAGGLAGDVPLIAGAFAGFTTVASVLSGTVPLIAGSFVGGMATIGAMAGDVPLIAGAFNDGPIGAFAGDIPLAAGDFPAWAGTAADGIWLYIATQPPAQVYATDAIRGRLSPWLPMHRAKFDVSATQSQIGARNDAFGVAINGIGASLRARLAAQAPFGVRVDVMDGGDVSRSGIVSDIGNSADGTVSIDCESAGWTTPLPLRTNADLGTFRDVEPLPWRYGRAVSGRCVRLGPSGKLWLWADHASERISSVQVDGQDYGAWQWRNDVDAGGNPITVIATADEIEEGADIVAVGDGARDRINGDLITNPADVVADLCARAGRSIDRGDLVPFRAECLARSLEVSGTIDSGSLQGALVSLADSIHAVFARDLAGLMRLLPRTGATVTIPARDTPTARAERANIATRLRVRYALEDDRPRASIEVRALGVELVRGIASADVVLPWIKDPRSAVDVATRMLGDRARASYVVPAIAAQRTRVLSGHVVSVSVPALGLSGEALVTSAKIDEDGSTPTMLLRVGSAPTISIAAQAAAYTPDQYTGGTVTTVGDQRQLTISGPDGRPLAGARCTLNGSLVRVSDGAGRVQFPAASMPPGQHSILIEAVGMDPQTLSVTVP